MIIGERLKEARLKKNISQEVLGNMLGVSKVAISNYETGIRVPTLNNFLKLVELLDLDIRYILGLDEPASKKDII